ncbi:MAG: MarR family transcriptional regulator [Gordonia sp. (in: high G+C Gram-positive bacteria)]
MIEPPGSGTITDDDPRPDAWRRFIETSARVSTAIDDELRADADMSLSDYHVLLLLSEAPEHRLRMKELSQRMVFSASRLTYQVDVMCRRGWLRRERAAEDRRGSYACLTDDGAAAFRAAFDGHFQQVRRVFFDALTPDDGRSLATVMRTLADHLDHLEDAG